MSKVIDISKWVHNIINGPYATNKYATMTQLHKYMDINISHLSTKKYFEK